MTVEERLRAAMHAHDVEAPTHVPWPAAGVAPARHRPTGRFLLAAALVAVLVAGGTWLALAWPRPARTSLPAAPLSCPAERGPGIATSDVPAPATVPDAADRLVPTATPDSAVVCGYVLPAGSTPPGYVQQDGTVLPGDPVALTGSAALSGDLAPLARQLSGYPQSRSPVLLCPANDTGTESDYYLIGLTYADGIVWVSAPGNHCAGASNGAFTTLTNVNTSAAASIAAGHWVDVAPGVGAQPTTKIGCPLGEDRPGIDATMVPGTPMSVTLCVDSRVDVRSVGVPATRIAELAAALNALPATPSPYFYPDACGDSDTYGLTFGYESGPEVHVFVAPGCDPGVGNDARKASGSTTLAALLAGLAG